MGYNNPLGERTTIFAKETRNEETLEAPSKICDGRTTALSRTVIGALTHIFKMTSILVKQLENHAKD